MSICTNCHEDRVLYLCGNHWLCQDCRSDAGFVRCFACSGYYHTDDTMLGVGGGTYCNECFDERFGHCEDCGETSYLENLTCHSDGWYCSNCRCGEFAPKYFVGRDSYTMMPSRRKFGVELETNTCPGHYELNGSVWGSKHDCSINGMEFDSSILYGDDGLAACVFICQFADDNGWSVDRCCGYHAHFDMSEETDDSLKAIALAYFLTNEVWRGLVDSRRLTNSFCTANCASISDICATSFNDFASGQSRYEWINFAAYRRHRTFEIRVHEGTLDPIAVTNWIRAHATFMDWASEAGWAKVRNTFICMNKDEKFEFISQLWAQASCEDLGEYYNRETCAV